MLPKKRKPAHPGKILKDHFLEPMGITQARFVEHLGGTWTPAKLNNLIHEKRNVTPPIALDFADAFQTTPEFWMNLQMTYDLWNSIREHESVEPIDDKLSV